MKEPKPVPSFVICDTCGQPWPEHTKIHPSPTLETCIKVLLAELARRPQQWHLPMQVDTGWPKPLGPQIR